MVTTIPFLQGSSLQESLLDSSYATAVDPAMLARTVVIDKSDAELVKLAQKGDSGAFDALFERYFDQVYGYVRQSCFDVAEAEDITQETFSQAFHKIHTIWSAKKFRAWIYAIAHNTTCSLQRAQVRRKRAMGAYQANLEAQGQAGAIEDFRTPYVQEAFDSLKPIHREALLLCYFQGLKHEEIAQVLERKKGTIGWLIHEARKELRMLVEQQMEQEHAQGSSASKLQAESQAYKAQASNSPQSTNFQQSTTTTNP